jgi:hypothetical protein
MSKVIQNGRSYYIAVSPDLRALLQLDKGDRVYSSFEIIRGEPHIVTKKIKDKC